MTYKQRTIEACKELAAKYRNMELGKNSFFLKSKCPFCHIYQDYYCKGCFMNNNYFIVGCTLFKTYKKVIKYFSYKNREVRANFFDEMVIELEEYPEEQFTPEGFKYFKIDRNR